MGGWDDLDSEFGWAGGERSGRDRLIGVLSLVNEKPILGSRGLVRAALGAEAMIGIGSISKS